MSFSNIPPPQGMPELVAILDVVQNADKLREAVQQIMDALDRANATRKQASEEVEAAMTEAAMVRKEAEQARDEMLTAATLEAKRIRDEAEMRAKVILTDADNLRRALMADEKRQDDDRAKLRADEAALAMRAQDLTDQSASLKRREDALREREAGLEQFLTRKAG